MADDSLAFQKSAFEKPKAEYFSPKKPAVQPAATQPAVGELIRTIRPAENVRMVWDAILPDGLVGKDVISSPCYWVNVASKVKVGHEIVAKNEDLTVYCRMLVQYAQGNDIRLWVLEYVEMGEVEEEVRTSNYDVRRKGTKGWCVIDKRTGVIVFRDIATQVDAYQRMADHERALSR